MLQTVPFYLTFFILGCLIIWLSRNQWLRGNLQLYLYARLVPLALNPLFLFFIFLIYSWLIKTYYDLFVLFDLLLHETFPIIHMMEGPQDSGSGQPTDTNVNSSTGSSTHSPAQTTETETNENSDDLYTSSESSDEQDYETNSNIEDEGFRQLNALVAEKEDIQDKMTEIEQKYADHSSGKNPLSQEERDSLVEEYKHYSHCLFAAEEEINIYVESVNFNQNDNNNN